MLKELQKIKPHMMVTFAPEELGLRNFSKMLSPVAARNKKKITLEILIYIHCSAVGTLQDSGKSSYQNSGTYDSKSTL
jgi:hypothetical protein